MNSCFRHTVRRFSSSVSHPPTVIEQPWLSKAIQMPQSTTAKDESSTETTSKTTSSGKTQITRLANGLHVASQQSLGDFCTIGVGVNAGSRYEMFSPAGVTHFLEKLAFGPTAKYKSRDDILNTLALNGGICDCQFSRDVGFFALSISKSSVPTGVDILSQVVLHPTISHDLVDSARSLVAFDLLDHEESLARMQPDVLLHDMIHRAAFRGNTVGLSKFCPKEHLEKIMKEDLESYLNTYIQPDRTVVVGVGVDHDYLCKLVEDNFNFGLSSFNSAAKVELDESAAQYTGGELRIDKDLTPVTGGDNPLPELAHVVIGMESFPSAHPNYIPVSVLSFIMGGGSSFSAGGPGKGMYSRLYSNILNRYHFVHHASIVNFPYHDCGLFALQLSSEPDRVKETCQVGIRECLNMVEKQTGEEEFGRAKNQLKSTMLSNLEAKPVQMEDIARQVLAHGIRKESDEVCDMIDAVTKADLARVSEELISSKISVAALGQIKDVPSQRDLTYAFINNASFPKGKSSKFNIFT